MGFPQLFWLAQKIDNRHDELYRRIKSSVTEDAATAISTGNLTDALELLDGRRNKIWSQLQLLGAPVDDLRAVSSELADELESASHALKIAAMLLSTSYIWDPDPERSAAAQHHMDEYTYLEQQYFTVLGRVQELPGFVNFRDPKKFAELTQAAVDGPVVIINVSEARFSEHQTRCDALVLTRPGSPITHVPLPNFSHRLAETLHFSMSSYLKHSSVRSCDDRAMRFVNPVRNRIRSILACLWMYVVQPILEAIEQTVGPA